MKRLLIALAAGATLSAVGYSVVTSPVAQGQSACADLGGMVAPDQTCHVHTVTATYQITIGFPLDYPDLPAVTDFVAQDRAGFLDWVGKFGPDGRARPYEYVVTAKTYRSGTSDSGTQSLVLHIDNDTGLANQGHPNTTFATFTFDHATKAPITFGSLFKPNSQPRAVLDPIVRRQLSAPSAELTDSTYQHFAITDDAMIFFFGQNQVAQDNAGPHIVSVPRTELASLLT